MTRAGLADACWLATVAAMPLVGVGVSAVLGGPDLGTGLQPAYLLLALSLVLRCPDWRHRDGDRPDRTLRRLLIGGGAVLTAASISALGLRLAPAPVMAAEAAPRFVRQFAQLVLMLGFLAHAALWTRGPSRWRLTVTAVAAGTTSQLLLAPLMAWHDAGTAGWLAPLSRLVTSNPGILSGSSWLYVGEFLAVPRLRGSMCEPLYLGSYLLVALPLLAISGRRVLAALAALLLLATWSRGAWLAAGVGAVAWWGAWAVAGRPWRPHRATILAAAGGLALAVVALLVVAGGDGLWLPWRRLAQTADLSDWSNLTRIYSAQAAWRAFLQAPLTGVGWGQFPYHFYALVDLTGLQSQFTWPVVNSIPLLVLAETGLPGGLVVVGLVAASARLSRRALRGAGEEAALVAALVASLVATGAHLLVFSQYNLPHLWVLPGWWLAAVADRRGSAANTEVSP